MFQRWFKKKQLRQEKIKEAREQFVSWLDISKSNGWKTYQDKIEQKVEIIKNKFSNDLSLNGEELKRLQLALQVYKEIQRIPKELEDNAKKGV
jgi:hypothetical protein